MEWMGLLGLLEVKNMALGHALGGPPCCSAWEWALLCNWEGNCAAPYRCYASCVSAGATDLEVE